MTLKIVKIIVIFFLVNSCKNNTVYIKHKSITNNQWHKDSVVSFEIDIKDTISKHAIFMYLRNDKEYAFNNIFLITSIILPNKTIVSDTLEYKMTDERGYFLGTGSTDVKENKLELKENIQFTNKGTHTITVQQAMRKNSEELGVTNLGGVTNVGIEIEQIIK